MHDLAVGGDDLQRGYRGREIAVLDSGAVGRGGAGSDRGDMGQRGKVVEGESLLVDVGSEGAVPHPCANGDGLCLRVEHHGIEMGE